MTKNNHIKSPQPLNVLSKKALARVALATSLVLPFSTYAPLVSAAFDESNVNNYTNKMADLPFPELKPLFHLSPKTTLDETVIVEIEYPLASVLNEYRINGGDWLIYDGPLNLVQNSLLEAKGTNIDGIETLINSQTLEEIIEESQKPPVTDNGTVNDSVPPTEENSSTPEQGESPEQSEETDSPEVIEPPLEVENVPVEPPIAEENKPNIGEIEKPVEIVPPTEVLPPITKPVLNVTDTAKGSIDVEIVYPEAADIRQYRFTLKNGQTEGWMKYTEQLSLTVNGLLEAQAVDTKGNKSEIVSHSISTLLESEKLVDEKPEISLETTDTIKGIVKVAIIYPESSVTREYRIDGGEWLAYAEAFSVTENCVIDARGLDVDGNETLVATQAITTIEIHEEKPVITVSSENLDDRSVLVTIEYPESSVTREYRFDGGEWIAYDTPFTVKENGLIEARGIDVNGKETTLASYAITTITVVENTAPKLNLFNSVSIKRMMRMMSTGLSTTQQSVVLNTTESTDQEQTQTFKIPGLTKLNSVMSNTGNVEVVGVDGDEVTVKATNGSRSKQVQTGGEYISEDTKMIDMQSTADYNADGYVGTLVKYVSSGAYIPETSETIADERKSPTNSFPATIVKDGVTLVKDGSVTSVQTGGTYTAADTKVVTDKVLREVYTQIYTYYASLYDPSGQGNPKYYNYSEVWSLMKPGNISGGTVMNPSSNYHNVSTQVYNASPQGSLPYNSGGYVGTLVKDSRVYYEIPERGYSSFSYPGLHNGEYGGYVFVDKFIKTQFGLSSYWYPGFNGQTKTLNQNSYHYYSGSVTKPASDTRTYEYTQKYKAIKVIPEKDTRVYHYKGNVTRQESDTRTYQDYFKYELTFDYDTNTAPGVTLPSGTHVSSLVVPFNVFSLRGQAVDKEGDEMKLVVSLVDVPELQNVEIPIGVDGIFDEQVQLPSTLSEGTYTVSVYVEDIHGDASPAETFEIYVDTTAPTITIGGVDHSQSYQDSVTPLINAQDNIAGVISTVITLNGEPFTSGTLIDIQGDYTLVVVSTDQVGNSSTDTRTFTVNTKPEIDGAIPDTNLAKFEETTIDLAPLFKNTQVGEMTYEANSADPTVAEVSIIGSTLTIKALKQGNTTVNIKAKNATSYSSVLPMTLIVDNAAPSIAIDEDTWSLVGDGDSVVVTGTVSDVDKDAQSITGSLAGLSATTTIQANDDVTDPWTLTFDTTSLAEGVYSPLSIQTTDEFGASHTIARTKPVVRVAGSAAEYQEIVTKYEGDTGKGVNEWTEETHNKLLDATIAIRTLIASNTVENQLDAAQKVSALVSGVVKSEYESTISGNAFEWLKQNLAIATESNYVAAGINGVTSANLIEVRKWATLHLTDIGSPSFEKANIDTMIVLANHVLTAESSNLITDWLAVLSYGQSFTGTVEAEVIRLVDEMIFSVLDANPSSLTIELLTDYFSIPAKAELLTDYQDYLTDIVTDKSLKIDLTDVTTMVQAVDETISLQSAVQLNPTREATDAYMSYVEALIDGTFKTKHKDGFANVHLINFVTYPNEQGITNYTNLGITAIEAHIPEYKPNLVSYITDIGIPQMTVSMIQDVVNATDALIEYKKNPSDTTLKDLTEAVDKLDPDTELSKDLKGEIKDAVLDSINKNPGTVTVDGLEKVGVTDVNPDLLPDYQGALEEYKKDIAPAELTLEDIQAVIDAINAVKNARENPSTTTIENAYTTVGSLKDGNLKDDLLQQLEDIAVDYITSNPSSIVEKDLDHANIENVNSELTGEYQDHLLDVLPSITPVTKDSIQSVIDTVNTIDVLYKAVLADPTRVNLEAYVVAVEALQDGAFKTTYKGYIPTLSLSHLVTYPAELRADSLGWAEITFVAENVSVYQQYVPRYIGEVGKVSVDKATYQTLITWLDSYVVATTNPNDSTIQDFINAGGTLDKATDIYKELSKDVNDSLLESLNKDISNVTEKELEQIGITNVKPELLPDYQEALEEYRKDLLPEKLTIEDIQAVIDAINAVEYARNNPSTDSIAAAYIAVEALKSGNLKTDLLQQVEDIAVKFIGDNPLTFTEQDLLHANIKNVNVALINDYRLDMEDTYPHLLPAKKADIQNIVYIVNAMQDAYEAVMNDPTRDKTVEFRDTVNGLLVGQLKDKYLSLLPDVVLTHLTKYPEDVQVDSLTWAEVTFNELLIVEYKQYLPTYQTDVATFTKVLLDTFTSVLDDFIIAMEDTSSLNVSKAVISIATLEDGELKTTLLKELSIQVLDSINKDIGNVTVEDLEQAGITDLDSINEHEYQEALKEYKENIARDLTIDDIQKVVDSINNLVKAETNPTVDNLIDAKVAIDKLEEGSLKDKLIERLENAAADNINQNITDVTVGDLEMAGITDVNPDLLEDYKEHLELYKPLTKEKIQAVIDVVNQLQITLREATEEEIENLLILIKTLEDSLLKDELMAVHTGIDEITRYETTGNAFDTVTDAIGVVATSTKSYLQNMATGAEKMHEALNGPTDDIIDDAIATITDLRDGDFKSRMLERVGESYFDFVQNNPDKVTEDELVKAGFERVRPNLIEEYKEGFVSLTDELGTLDRPIIQLVIDVVNSIDDAKSLAKAIEAKGLIETLPDSEWKTDKLNEINKLIIQFTPAPPSIIVPDDSFDNDSDIGGNTTPPVVVPPVTEKPTIPTDSKPVNVVGTDTGNGYDFVIDSDFMEGIINNKSESITLTQGDNVTIDIPLGAIDFDKLLKELGKYGLLIQLIKLDEKNYRLVVKAITEEGEREIKNFAKHLSVALKEDSRVTDRGMWIASTQPVGKPLEYKSVVLRKDGESLTAVPHLYDKDRFTIRTTRAGHFIVKKQFITFDDIQNVYSKDAIEELASRQIVFGTSESTYSPNSKITRAQLAAMIARAMDLQATSETSFTDVKGKWYEKDVQALYEAGIIQGTSATTFNPGGFVTRQQAASMMNRALAYGGVKIDANGLTFDYTDSESISDYARKDIAVLQSLSIMTGKEDGRFDPQSSLTRVQMAKVLSGMLKKMKFM